MKPVFRIVFAFLFCSLTACGGGGGADGASSTGSPAPTVPSSNNSAPRNVLFVGDSGHHALAGVATLAPTAGTQLSANVLLTGDFFGAGFAYDAQTDRLFALMPEPGNFANSIAIFEKAGRSAAPLTPTRYVWPDLGEYFPSISMLYDKLHDRMYVAGFYSIAVFDNFTTLSVKAKPNRVVIIRDFQTDLIYSTVTLGAFTVDVKRNLLYATGVGGNTIYVVANADQANGPTKIDTKTITLHQGGIMGLAIDAERDRLYANMPRLGIGILTGASTRNASVIPLMVSFPKTGSDGGIAYDPLNDRLYAGVDNTAYIMNSASLLAEGTPASVTAVLAPEGSKIANFAF